MGSKEKNSRHSSFEELEEREREREREWKTVGLKGCEDFCDESGGGEFKMERKSARKEMFVNGINERKFWERYQWEGNLGHSIFIGPPGMIQIWKYLGCNFLHESHNPLVFQKNILRIYVTYIFKKEELTTEWYTFNDFCLKINS